MDPLPVTAITVHFADLPDPRRERTRLHELQDILTIAICAVLCGADGWTEVELFGQAKEAWFRTFLKLPHGIPSHDTFGRVFEMLDPQAFESCFRKWIGQLSEDLAGEVVPIDGKTVRRSLDRAAQAGPLHLVSAWAVHSGLSLGQVATAAKSNEITALPQLLKLLDIRGATITIDAIGTQKEIAQQIIDQEGDYVLAVKDNQPKLRAEVVRLMDEVRTSQQPGVCDYHETVEKDHGRVEVRRVWCTGQVSWLREAQPWAQLASVVLVESLRTVGTQTTTQHRYYISSLAAPKAQRMAAVIRQHWAIENQLHWVLDMAFGEDRSRVRKGHGAANLALLRKLALNLLKQDTTIKAGIKSKRLRAGWDHQFLLHLLRGRI